MGIRRLRVQGDSKLVIQQVNGEFSLKEGALASYRKTIQKLTKFFSSIQFEYVLRSHNKHADALATLASKAEIRDDVAEIKVIRNTLRAITTDLILDQTVDEREWRKSVIRQLSSTFFLNKCKGTQGVHNYRRTVYYQGSGGILATAISEAESKEQLKQIHDSTCADNDISLYRRIQRQCYYWPSMPKNAAHIQQN